MTAAAKALWSEYEQARSARGVWESLWRDCYRYSLPQSMMWDRGAVGTPGTARGQEIFDGTGPDAVDALANAMLTEMTPPTAQWVRYMAASPPGTPAEERDAHDIGMLAQLFGNNIRDSNFAPEAHGAYLDLVVGGTAGLVFDEADDGADSLYRFQMVPLAELFLCDTGASTVDRAFRAYTLPVATARQRWPEAGLKEPLASERWTKTVEVLSLCAAVGYGRWQWTTAVKGDDDARIVEDRLYRTQPLIVFRWQRSPGEIYGRSPVMKALPDIKTANKIIELTLKNAAIAVAGLWQADDDGVINPATVRLVPGTIVPKAVGSAGLQPLKPAGDFNVANLLLEDLRARIRRALHAEQLVSGAPKTHITAAEVLQRTAENGMMKGGAYGRLVHELLDPLVGRGLDIGRRRGWPQPRPRPAQSGWQSQPRLEYDMPLARQQRAANARDVVAWAGVAAQLGPDGLARMRVGPLVHYLGIEMGVPASLMVADAGEADEIKQAQMMEAAAAQMAAAPPAGGAPGAPLPGGTEPLPGAAVLPPLLQ